MDKSELSRLQGISCQVKRNIVNLVGVGKAGHLGGSCSIADIMTVLYFHTMRYRADDPHWKDRDRLILSKGHTALCQYAALGELGLIGKEEFSTVKALGSRLQGHPDMRKCPGIEANTGSLGQGLSISLGIALGLRLDANPAYVYCILGDGELDEGQCWEAAMAAASYQEDHLIAIVDCNRVQATDETKNVLKLGSIEDKFAAFGWNTISIDGHDISQIAAALDEAKTVKGKPTVIVAETIKGKGVSFAEGKAAFHNCILTQEQYDQAVSELA